MTRGFQQILLFCALMFTLPQVWAAGTGRSAALKYFTKKPNSESAKIKVRQPQSSSSGSDRGLIAIGAGSLIQTKSYDWAGNDLKGWSLNASYQSLKSSYFNRGYELEFQKISAGENQLSKLSFLLSFSFPKRLSFPVYVGVAAGPGYFFKQTEGESEFTIDYKAYLGLRLNRSTSQYFLQSGVKNHVHVLSDGQFVGWFVSSGVAYKF